MTTKERMLYTSQTFSHLQERMNFNGSMKRPFMSPATMTRKTPSSTERPIGDSQRETISSHMMRQGAAESYSSRPQPGKQSNGSPSTTARSTRPPPTGSDP